MEVNGPSGSVIFSTWTNTTNSTASFTYKVSNTAIGGTYSIRVFGNILPSNRRVIRVLDYTREQLNIDCEFSLEAYYSGDTVGGTIVASLPDGSRFKTPP